MPDPAAAILALVRERTGVDFGGYRHAMVMRRVHTCMAALDIATLDEYLEVLKASPEQTAHLVSRVVIKVSRFYRDAATFDVLRRQVLPRLIGGAGSTPLSLWSAGCGNGEEAYTLAMLLEEAGCPGTVAATDVDPSALDAAARGTYPDAAVAELPRSLASRFLESVEENGEAHHRVSAGVRSRVRWAAHDLTSDTPFPAGAPFHLVVCRNVLIYLNRDTQVRVLTRLVAALRDEGVLCLGEAEWPVPDVAGSLAVVGARTRLFRVHQAPPPRRPS